MGEVASQPVVEKCMRCKKGLLTNDSGVWVHEDGRLIGGSYNFGDIPPHVARPELGHVAAVAYSRADMILTLMWKEPAVMGRIVDILMLEFRPDFYSELKRYVKVIDDVQTVRK